MAGFSQAFRSLVPEAVEGANAGARFESYGLALDQKLRTGMYLGLTGEWLESPLRRTAGTLDLIPASEPISPPRLELSKTREGLELRERTWTATFHQLLGEEWSVGVRYRVSLAELERQFVDLPTGVPAAGRFRTAEELEVLLHQVGLWVLFTHPSGFFGQAEALWTKQGNRGYTPVLPGDQFWQVNLFAGYRFARRRAEVRLDLKASLRGTVPG